MDYFNNLAGRVAKSFLNSLIKSLGFPEPTQPLELVDKTGEEFYGSDRIQKILGFGDETDLVVRQNVIRSLPSDQPRTENEVSRAEDGLNEHSQLEMINLLRHVCGVTPLKCSQGNEASRQKTENNSTLWQDIDFEQELKPFSAFDESRAENIKIQTQKEFRHEEVLNDMQNNIITIKQKIARLTEENERNRSNENTLVQVLKGQNEEIEKLTLSNKYLTDSNESLKRKIQVFEQKSTELESRLIDQSVYDKISTIVQTQLHRYDAEKYDVFKMNNMQRDIDILRTELTKTNSQTEKFQRKLEKFERKFCEQKIRLQAVERNVTETAARFDRTDYRLWHTATDVFSSTGLTYGRRGTVGRDDASDESPPPRHTGHRHVAPSPSPPPQSSPAPPSPPQSSPAPPSPPPPPPSSSSSPPPPPPPLPSKSSPPPPSRNTAGVREGTATEPTPPRMLITDDMLRAVKLKPASERQLGIKTGRRGIGGRER